MKPWMKELLFGGLAVAILVTVINISYNQGKFDARIATNTERIKDIAGVLRDLGVRFAWEAIYTPFPTVVLVGQPVGRAGNRKIGMGVIDTQRGKLTAYEAKLSGRKFLALMVGGSLKALDKRALSIEEMEAFAKEIKSPLIAPSYINKRASHIVYKSTGVVKTHLKGLGFTKTGDRNVPKADVWPDFVAAMKANKLRLKLFQGKAPPPPAP